MGVVALDLTLFHTQDLHGVPFNVSICFAFQLRSSGLDSGQST
jgi:hypothetical protein